MCDACAAVTEAAAGVLRDASSAANRTAQHNALAAMQRLVMVVEEQP